jgi:hypothetical protein
MAAAELTTRRGKKKGTTEAVGVDANGHFSSTWVRAGPSLAIRRTEERAGYQGVPCLTPACMSSLREPTPS